MQQFKSGSGGYYIQLKLRTEFGVDFHSPGEIWPGDPSYPLFWKTMLLKWYLNSIAVKYTSEHPLLTTTAWHNREYLTACMYLLPSEKSALEPHKALAPWELYPILGESR